MGPVESSGDVLQVLHVSQPTSGGTAVVVLQLVEAAVARGHTAIVASPDAGFLKSESQRLGAAWIEVPMRRSPRLEVFGAIIRLRRMFQTADVVHLHSSMAGALGRIAAWTMRRPPTIVFVPHGWSWLGGGLSGRLFRFVERRLAGQAACIVAVSDGEYREGVRVLGPVAQLTIVHNGIDTERFRPGGGARDPDLVVCVGRLAFQKGQDRLVSAFSELANDSLRLVLVGDGPMRGDLESRTAALGLTSRVTFVGEQDPLPYLQDAGMVVLPSRWEGLSLALLEAMACGNAVIACTCEGTEVLQDVGLTVENASDCEVISSLARSMEALANDRTYTDSLGRLARERAVSNHSVDRTQAAYADLWDRVTRACG